MISSAAPNHLDRLEKSSETEVNSHETSDFLGWKSKANLNSGESVRSKTRLEESLDSLSRLVANVTESHTTAIFVANPKDDVLHCLAHHSLSRDFIEDSKIPFGSGLVGWTAENKVRIAVCPFENDASTLLYYPTDQNLKSFIAVPILDPQGELVGVIACDSKKSYAFAKVTEKILAECANQASLIIDLHTKNQTLSSYKRAPQVQSQVESVLNTLREANSEIDLFDRISNIPQSFVGREALISVVSSHEGFGTPTFYSSHTEQVAKHHLMDLVCEHKRILSKDKSVHVLPNDDIASRSFLSVPFNAFGSEAGAINVLSRAATPYSDIDIRNLERVAYVVGREIERIRAKKLAEVRQVGPCLLSWERFLLEGQDLINAQSSLALARIEITGKSNLELSLGVDVVAAFHEQLIRSTQQVCAGRVLASAPYGSTVFLFGSEDEVEICSSRLRRLFTKVSSGVAVEATRGQVLPVENFECILSTKPKKAVSVNCFFNQADFSGKTLDVEARPTTRAEDAAEIPAIKPTSTLAPKPEAPRETADFSSEPFKLDVVVEDDIWHAPEQTEASSEQSEKNSECEKLSTDSFTRKKVTSEKLASEKFVGTFPSSKTLEEFVFGEIREEEESYNARFWK